MFIRSDKSSLLLWRRKWMSTVFIYFISGIWGPLTFSISSTISWIIISLFSQVNVFFSWWDLIIFAILVLCCSIYFWYSSLHIHWINNCADSSRFSSLEFLSFCGTCLSVKGVRNFSIHLIIRVQIKIVHKKSSILWLEIESKKNFILKITNIAFFPRELWGRITTILFFDKKI